MSDEELDVSAYEADVIEHVLVGRARARMLEDVRDGKPWNADLERGELKLGATTFRAQILGTFSLQSGTFLWAWANPGSDGWTNALTVANALRARGAQPGQAVFAEASIAAGWVNPNELAYVSGELAGGHPVFVGGYDGGAAGRVQRYARVHRIAPHCPFLPRCQRPSWPVGRAALAFAF